MALFLSTLPARGATVETEDDVGGDIFLSTLPARGATLSQKVLHLDLARFLSTLPARGATWRQYDELTETMISIHAPREGSDRRRPWPFARAPEISIHAPREGSDAFQGGTADAGDIFLSTLPARGATRTRCTRFLSLASFLSTLPARGATLGHLQPLPADVISIHAPREGSD